MSNYLANMITNKFFRTILLTTGITLSSILFTATTKAANYSNISQNTSFTAQESLIETTSIPHLDSEFVTIGDPGNQADDSGRGAVQDVYRIGKYNVTVREYTTFLNAVAISDTYRLYSEKMDANHANTILRTGEPGHYCYTTIEGREDQAITNVNWYSAARYCNWLQHDQPCGEQNETTTETGAYTLNSTSNTAIPINEGASYFLPDESQWYKAALYMGNATYRTFPPGMIEEENHYGTCNIIGSIAQWTSSNDGNGNYIVSGFYLSQDGKSGLYPLFESDDIGFRIAAPAALPILTTSQPETTLDTVVTNVMNSMPSTSALVINKEAMKVAIEAIMLLLGMHYAYKIIVGIVGIVALLALLMAFTLLPEGVAAWLTTAGRATSGWIYHFFADGGAAALETQIEHGAALVGDAAEVAANNISEMVASATNSPAVVAEKSLTTVSVEGTANLSTFSLIHPSTWRLPWSHQV